MPPWRMAGLALMLALPIVALRLAAPAAPVSANGQTVAILDTEQGPYRVEVRVAPPTPRVGNLHVSVVLQTRDDLQPVGDAAVRLRALGPSPESLLLGPLIAVPDAGLPNWYDLNLALPQDGEWRFTLDILRGDDTTVVEFPVLVRAGGVNWGVVAVVIASLPLLVSAAWYVRQATGRRPPTRRATRRRRR